MSQPPNYTPSRPARPPRPDNRRATIVIVAVAVAVLLVGSVMIFATAEPASQTSRGSNSDNAGASSTPSWRGDPRPVNVGEAFTLGKHRFDAGWKVQYREYLGPQLVGQVTNVSKDTSTAFFHVKFLKGAKVVANFQCTTGDLEPGQSEDVECYNTIDVTGDGKLLYDKVTAEATF